MFNVWVFCEKLRGIFSVDPGDVELKVQEYAEMYPHLIYFFAELSPV